MVTLRCACTNVEAGATSRAAISVYVPRLLRCKLPHDDLSVNFGDTASDSAVQLRSQLWNTPRPVEGSFLVSTTRLAANSGLPVSAIANQYNSSISVRLAFHFATPHQLLKFGVSLSGLGVGTS